MTNRNSRESRRSRSRSPLKVSVKSKRLLVSNIPFNTTLNELKDIFKEKIGICGKLDFIEKNGKFTGNAIMEFKTLDGSQKAVTEMHKYNLNGREIIVREETNKDRDRLNLCGSQQNNIPHMGGQIPGSLYQMINDLEKDGPITNSLFIANLDYTLTWQKLKDMFKTAGRVKHVDLKTDAEGKSRGFGTVEFESPEEAVMAIHMFNNKMINNREMKLRMDKSGKPVLGGLDMSRFGNIEQPIQNSSLSPQIRRVLEDILASITNPNRSNPQALKALNELLSLAQMMDRNQSHNYPPVDNMGMVNNFDRNPGYGNPNSRNWNDQGHSNLGNDNMLYNQNLDNPYFRDRMMMDNKPLGMVNDFSNRMGRDFQPDSARDMRFNLGNSQNPGSGNRDMMLLEDILQQMKNSGNFDQFGVLNLLSSVINNKRPDDSYSGVNQLHSGSSRPPNEFLLSGGGNNSSNTLLIKNIPFSYTWKDLKHSFSQASGIVHAEVIRDEFNRSKGMGLVRFETHPDAVRCKNMMDGTLFDGRPIHIEFSNPLK